jgi:outer membrane lipoprotein SlyB
LNRSMQLLSVLVHLAVLACSASDAGLHNNVYPASSRTSWLSVSWENVYNVWPKHVLPDMEKLVDGRNERFHGAENCTDVPAC